jgi:predicted amino acid dehydrogenase
MAARFGFVVHALSPLHRAAIGVRSGNAAMALYRDDGLSPAGITDLCTLRLGALSGTVIAIPMTPEQLLVDQQRTLGRMAQAVRMLGPVDAVGLGSLCAVVAGRGEALADAVDCPITTGGAATAWALVENTLAAAARARAEGPIAVIGSRSPVGKAVASRLAAAGWALRLDSRRAARKLPGAEGFDGPAAAAEGCSLIVGAGPTGGTLPAAAVSPGAVVVDVAIPATIIGRPPPGVRIFSGEALALPAQWRSRGWGWLYHLLAGYGLSQVYACLVEPLVMASLGRTTPLALGRAVSDEAVQVFGEEALRLGFRPVLLPDRGLLRWL